MDDGEASFDAEDPRYAILADLLIDSLDLCAQLADPRVGDHVLNALRELPAGRSALDNGA